jgi:putative FmdB family regulatory protein
MPIYEYQCNRCGQRFEVRQGIGEGSHGLNCPKCNASNPRRLFSSFFSRGSSGTEASEMNYPTCSSGVCGLPPMG